MVVAKFLESLLEIAFLVVVEVGLVAQFVNNLLVVLRSKVSLASLVCDAGCYAVGPAGILWELLYHLVVDAKSLGVVGILVALLCFVDVDLSYVGIVDDACFLVLGQILLAVFESLVLLSHLGVGFRNLCKRLCCFRTLGEGLVELLDSLLVLAQTGESLAVVGVVGGVLFALHAGIADGDSLGTCKVFNFYS